MSVLGLPGIVSYTSSGALAPYDDTSVLTGASQLTMSLGVPGQFSRDRVILNTGTATNTVSVTIDGAATTLSMAPGASVILRPSPGAGTWLQIGASGTGAGASTGSSGSGGVPTPGTNVVTVAGANYFVPVYVVGTSGPVEFISVPNFVDSTSTLASSLPSATVGDLGSAELVGYVNGTAKQVAPSVLAQYLASLVAPGTPVSPTLTAATGTSVSGTFGTPVSGGTVQNVQVSLATSSAGTYKAANTTWALSGSTYSFTAAGFVDGTVLGQSTTYFAEVVLGNVAGVSAPVATGNSVVTSAQAQSLLLSAPSGTTLAGGSFAVPVTFSPAYASAPTLTLKVDGATATQPTGGSLGASGGTVEVPGQTAGTHAIQVVDGSGNVSNTLSVVVSAGPFPMVFTGTAGVQPAGYQAVTDAKGGSTSAIVYDGSANLTVPLSSSGHYLFVGAGVVATGKTITWNVASTSQTHDAVYWFQSDSGTNNAYALIVTVSQETVSLAAFSGGNYSNVGSASLAAGSTGGTVSVMRTGTSIAVSVDGTLVHTFTDNTLTSSGGYVGVQANGPSGTALSLHSITVQ